MAIRNYATAIPYPFELGSNLGKDAPGVTISKPVKIFFLASPYNIE